MICQVKFFFRLEFVGNLKNRIGKLIILGVF